MTVDRSVAQPEASRRRLDFSSFRAAFEQKISELGLKWEVVGFSAADGRIYPFGTDTKVISTVFEALAAPLIHAIAEERGYTVEGSEQTVYPDFTLTPPGGNPPRIAVDIKTTYRRFNAAGKMQPFRYTLGSYTSFLRSPGAKKNIAYPYAEYGAHWVLGFLYTRRAGVKAKVYSQADAAEGLLCPYEDVAYFVQEKFRIVGLTPASGNTANIGSFPTRDIRELRDGRGPFSEHGKEVCDDYWRYYPRRAADREYSTVAEFLRWRRGRRGPGGH